MNTNDEKIVTETIDCLTELKQTIQLTIDELKINKQAGTLSLEQLQVMEEFLVALKCLEITPFTFLLVR